MSAAAVWLGIAALWLGSSGEDSGAVQAYRSGDYETATTLWLGELERAENPRERARLAFDLGNAAFRSGDPLRAVGWYTAALRLEPRDADAWANLELARIEAGLEPADRGDLADTLSRLLGSITLAESEWVVLAALGPLALALAYEALRGGALARRLVLAALALFALAAVPWIRHLARAGQHPLLVVSDRPAAARSEPRPDATPIASLPPGTEVERLDALPAWTRIRTPDGEAAWVRDDALFDLRR